MEGILNSIKWKNCIIIGFVNCIDSHVPDEESRKSKVSLGE